MFTIQDKKGYFARLKGLNNNRPTFHKQPTQVFNDFENAQRQLEAQKERLKPFLANKFHLKEFNRLESSKIIKL